MDDWRGMLSGRLRGLAFVGQAGIEFEIGGGWVSLAGGTMREWERVNGKGKTSAGRRLKDRGNLIGVWMERCFQVHCKSKLYGDLQENPSGRLNFLSF